MPTCPDRGNNAVMVVMSSPKQYLDDMRGEEPRPRDLADGVLCCQLQLNGVTGPPV